MSLKKKLGLGVASAALGLSLIGGGTYAYFNSVATTNNAFTAGTLNLAASPTTIIDVKNIKPGDWMNRTFKLENNGTLDISKVYLYTNYTVSGPNLKGDDFGKHIIVHFLKNEDKSSILGPSNVIASKTLYELKNMSPDAVKNQSPSFLGIQGGEKSGLDAGTKDNMYVKFEFVDNGKDQNEFQGASLQLEWKFDAQQTAGENK
ncbi:TasA family protein [Neobacillus vireti]|uniref:Spore coat-associated protein n=1 Tax=Neobacillus vireti LMG 21834 TaxID=1131730 RepID=A0AB94IN06_9BACI|nr:TasA family protein [Neobacillus vireti]ETI68437.1 spore coat-associated protein [Neobacillus vireti LMG 21834]KLT17261.1 cell division protein FtsN [Neobacillus vireti]